MTMTGMVVKLQSCLAWKEEGIMTYTCENCDKTETVSIKKTAHNYKIMEQKNATCTENGYSISACQTCNDKKKEEIVAKVIQRIEIKTTPKSEGMLRHVFAWQYPFRRRKDSSKVRTSVE